MDDEDLHPIRAFRKKHRPRLTQAKFGEPLGVTKFAVSKWESWDRKIEPETAEKIEQTYGIDARVLLGIPKRNAQKRREVA